MLLGNKTDLEAETRSLYQKSGMSHLLAISGLHVSVFGMSLYRFLRKIGGSLRLSGTAAPPGGAALRRPDRDGDLHLPGGGDVYTPDGGGDAGEEL